MFRNLTLFRLPDNAIPKQKALDKALDGAPLRAPGPLELATQGFASPFGRHSEAITHAIGAHTLLTFGIEARLLPAQVVNDALADKLDALETERGRRPGGKERQRLKDDVITDLLPRAFIKSARTNAWLDHDTGWLAIDSASRKTAEAVVQALREALGSFPATPIAAQASARMLLTGWLTGEELPDDFSLGDECELRDPGDDGAIVRCRRQDLSADEIREHVNAGKQVAQLAVAYDGRIQCVIGEDLTLRKLRVTDVVDENPGEAADAAAELDARFALMTGELGRLFKRLTALFDLA